MSFFFVIGSGKSEEGFLRFVSAMIFAGIEFIQKDNRRNKEFNTKKAHALSRRLFGRSGREGAVGIIRLQEKAVGTLRAK
jgi:hypothetical protein